MLNDTIPGTQIKYAQSDDAFSIIRPMIELTGGLTLSQLVKITGINGYTIANWVNRGFIPKSVNKKYYERHVARVLIISALKDCMSVEDIDNLMVMVNGNTEDESDDIVSDSRLYDMFCRVIRNLDAITLNSRDIEKAIRNVLTDYDGEKKKVLQCALQIMVYAYISGRCLEQIDYNMEELKKFKEV